VTAITLSDLPWVLEEEALPPASRLRVTREIDPLFGLAPEGVCHAAAVAGCAVGSYPTFSPLPFNLPRALALSLSKGGLFSVALSVLHH